MVARFVFAMILGVLAAFPAAAFDECKFRFQLNTQSSDRHSIVAGAESRGGFWRPISGAPGDVKDLAKYVGRLDICLRTVDGKPGRYNVNGQVVEAPSPQMLTCTATLLPDNKLLTNSHCFYDQRHQDAGFVVVDQARINFGYIEEDLTSEVKAFAVSNRELAIDKKLDAMLLQVFGDANSALGGHMPMGIDSTPEPLQGLIMIHHPKGDPQQYSSGTCQLHDRQREVPGTGSQLRHKCESTFGSSGALLLDARTLAVVGLHNTGGLGNTRGFNGGHKIAMISRSLDLNLREHENSGGSSVVITPPRDPEADANAALVAAMIEQDLSKRQRLLREISAKFNGTRAADSAREILGLMVPPQPVGQVLSVRSSGAGDYRTIKAAVEAADEGARIEIYPGRYREAVVVNKPLEIVGVGQRSTIILETDDGNVIQWNADTGRIANLTIRRLPGGKNSAVFFNGGTAILENSDLSSKSLAVVAVREGAEPTIRNNDIHNGEHSGVFFYDNSSGLVEGNNIYDNNSSAVQIKDDSDPVIRNNQMYGNKQSTVLIVGGGRGLIIDNEITDSGYSGIEVREDGNPVVRNNRITGSVWRGIRVYDGGRGTYEDNDLRGNLKSAFKVEETAGKIHRSGNITE